MAFGSSAKTPAKTQQSTQPKQNVNIFMDTKRGLREFRLMGNEVRVKQHWLAKEMIDGKACWVPSYYVPNDKRERKPINVAIFDPELGDGTWIGSNDRWYDNPIADYVNAIDDEDTKKKLFAKEVFYINVLHRTHVKTLEDGTLVYPDPKGKFPAGTEQLVAKPHNEVLLLQGSSGKVHDEHGDITADHMYAKLLRCLESGEIDPDSGNQIAPHLFDIRLVTTGAGIDTKRDFTITPNRDVIDWSNYEMFDLTTWPSIWPNEAIQALMDGDIDYAQAVKEFGIKQFPDRVPVEL